MKLLTQAFGVVTIAALAAILNSGCASAGSGGGLTLQQTHQQVQDAMLAFRNASAAGNVTTAEREDVQAAYKRYQEAYNAALAEAGSDEKAVAPDNVKAAAEGVVARLSALP